MKTIRHKAEDKKHWYQGGNISGLSTKVNIKPTKCKKCVFQKLLHFHLEKLVKVNLSEICTEVFFTLYHLENPNKQSSCS